MLGTPDRRLSVYHDLTFQDTANAFIEGRLAGLTLFGFDERIASVALHFADEL